MHITKKIYKVVNTLNLVQIDYIVAEIPKGAIDEAKELFELGIEDLASDTLSEHGAITKCERIELWELDNVLEWLDIAKKVNSGINLE